MRILFRSIVLMAAYLLAGMTDMTAPAHAAPGQLDPGFGRGGIAVVRFNNNISLPTDSVLQGDGKIVLAAAFNNTRAATEAFGVVRLLADGTPDPAFGRSGVALTAFTNFINAPSALALQSDGKIVVVGNATSADGTLSEFAIARFTPRGALDATFGQGGRVVTNFVGVAPGGVSNPATALLLLPNGQLLVAGSASTCGKCVHQTALARYNADGSLDASFGTAGLVNVQAIGAPNALALLSNGDVVALAATALAEFSPEGVLVTVSSTTQGASLVSSAGVGISRFLPNGQFVLAGSAAGVFGPHDIDIQVSRFNPLGNIDRSFNSPVFDFVGMPTAPESEAAQALAFQGNGQIVVGGVSVPAAGTSAFGLARLNADGTLDAAFGNGGTVTTVIGGGVNLSFSFVSSLIVQPDTKILAVGLVGNHSGQTFIALARYLGQ